MESEITRRDRTVFDGPDFNRWLRTNAIIASLFAAALLGMAIVAAVAPAPTMSADEGGAGAGARQTRRSEPALDLKDFTGALGAAPLNHAQAWQAPTD